MFDGFCYCYCPPLRFERWIAGYFSPFLLLNGNTSVPPMPESIIIFPLSSFPPFPVFFLYLLCPPEIFLPFPPASKLDSNFAVNPRCAREPVFFLLSSLSVVFSLLLSVQFFPPGKLTTLYVSLRLLLRVNRPLNLFFFLTKRFLSEQPFPSRNKLCHRSTSLL